jgi:energy-coupling factor transporter ATP-binding protein EcfA2
MFFNLRGVPDPLGILSIHASAVQSDKGALVFLGPSGTGKSSICRVLSSVLHPLADDTVYLIPRIGNIWEITGADNTHVNVGPLTETEAFRLKGVPVRALFRLYQSRSPRIEQIEHIQAGHCLVDAFFEVARHRWLSIEAKKAAFKALMTLAQTIPFYQFYFDLSLQTINLMLVFGAEN